MFERYTERARRVLFFARYEASQLGSVSIETEHLLLGLIREGKGLTSRIFARAHLSLADLRTEIEARSAHHDRASMSVEIPFSDETKRVLLAAHLEALEHDYIGTEHLLLGLLYEEQSVAGSLLIEKGCRLDDVRSEMVRLLSEKSAGQPEQSVRIVVPPAPKKRRAGPIRLVIVVAQADDAASRQLLAGARDACADARIADGAITVVPVPGVSQIPVTVQCAAETGMFDAAVCLGILVRATARHADSAVSAVAHGLQLVASRTTMPWSFGVLATDSVEEATGCATREGYEAAKAALEMVAVVRTLRDADSSGL